MDILPIVKSNTSNILCCRFPLPCIEKSTPNGVVLILEKDVNLEWKALNPAVLKYFPNIDFDFDQYKVDEALSDKSIKLVFIPFLK